MPNATPTSCTPTSTSTTLVEDGLEGRDNSFARNLNGQIRLLTGFGVFPNVQGQAASRLESGKWGWLFVLDQYGGGEDDPQVRLAVYHSPGTVDSGGSPTQPSWDGQDRWSIESDQVDSFGAPLHVDDAAFVVGGTVVARLPDTAPFSLRADTVRLDLPVQQVLVTLQLSADRKSVDHGVFVGASKAVASLIAFDNLAAQAGGLSAARAVLRGSHGDREFCRSPRGIPSGSVCDLRLAFGRRGIHGPDSGARAGETRSIHRGPVLPRRRPSKPARPVAPIARVGLRCAAWLPRALLPPRRPGPSRRRHSCI